MSPHEHRALTALHQRESARQQHDAAALQRAESQLAGLCEALCEARRLRDRTAASLDALRSRETSRPQPIDQAWSVRSGLHRARKALTAAEEALASTRAQVDEAIQQRDRLRQDVTTATARRMACEARLEAPARSPQAHDDT